QKQMIDIRAALQKKQIDMKAMVENDASDRAAFERLSREIADLQVQQKLAMFDADKKVVKNLNPEQQEQWKEIKSKRMQKRMHRGQRPNQEMRGPGEMMDESPDMMKRRYPAPPPEDD
ncbi:MAG: Spy/CpxP family protein refolding chaperone, partial [Bacteroidota bacterium]